MTPSELAILSLIAERPRHGYEIEQVIQQRDMREWADIQFSSIYYLLKKLKQKEFIVGYTGPQEGRGPAPYIYRITAAGEAAWKQATLKLLSQPQRVNNPFQLGLSNLPALPRDEALAALQRYCDELAERLAHIRRRANAQAPLAPHVAAMFEHSDALLEAERMWVEAFIEQWGNNEEVQP